MKTATPRTLHRPSSSTTGHGSPVSEVLLPAISKFLYACRMSTQSQYGDTVFLRDFEATATAEKLKRIQFIKGSDGIAYDEAWLQNLIMLQPGLLPVNQIEPAFSNMVPVCTELPMRAGFMDNLFVTPQGEIAVVECKLWRNPEARRKVLAQILDYASEMTTWDYEALEKAIKAARQVDTGRDTKSLFEIVCAGGEMEEVAFHDAVSRNLKRGRFLLLIVGDGIREGLETIAKFFQEHASLHFNLAIIELALFEVPRGSASSLSPGSSQEQPRLAASSWN